MAQRTSVNPTLTGLDGVAATPGNTGLAAVSGFTIRERSSSIVGQLPPTGGTGVLRSTSGVAASFTVDTSGAGTTGTKSTVSWWMRVVRTDPTLAALANGLSADFCNVTNGGVDIRYRCILYKDANAPADRSGIIYYPRDVNAIATATLAQGAGAGGGLNSPNLPFERWIRMGAGLIAGIAGTAEATCYMNGQTCGRLGTTMLTTGASVAALDGQTVVNIPGWTGVEFEVCGPFTTWNGTGNPDLTAKPSDNNSSFTTPINYDLAFFWPCDFSGPLEGDNWNKVSGVEALGTPTVYNAAGINNGRARLINNIAGASAGTVIGSTRSMGTLPFNAEGWVSVYFPDFLITTNANTTMLLRLMDAANATPLVSLQWTPATFFDNGGTKPLGNGYGVNVRFAVEFLLNSDGRAGALIQRTTEAAAGTAVYDLYSMFQYIPLPNWTPAALGRADYYFATGAAEVVEFGGMAVLRYNGKGICDSFYQANLGTLTPTMTALNRMGEVYCRLKTADGPCCPGFFIRPDGGPVYAMTQAAGWSGKTFDAFCRRPGRVLRTVPAQRFHLTGMIANDVGAATTPALAISEGIKHGKNAAQFIEAACASDSRVVYATGFLGTGGAFATVGAAKAASFLYNAKAEEARRSSQFNNYGRYTRLNTIGNYTGADLVHPDDTGAVAWMQEIQTKAQPVLGYTGSGDRAGR